MIDKTTIDLYFDGTASKDLSKFFDRQIMYLQQGKKLQPFDLVGCFVGSRDEDSNGKVYYTLHIAKIEEDAPTENQGDGERTLQQTNGDAKPK